MRESQRSWSYFLLYFALRKHFLGQKNHALSMGAATPGDSNNRGPSEGNERSQTLSWAGLASCSEVGLNIRSPTTPHPQSSYCNNLGTFLFSLT